MRFPSLKTLKTALEDNNLTDADFRLARKIGTSDSRTFILDSSKAADAVWRACNKSPSTEYLRMVALDEVLKMHGVEYAETFDHGCATYLNAGDTYIPTIIRWRGVYRVQSLDDFVETMERRGIIPTSGRK